MEQIEALERRLAAALERIGAALERPDTRAEALARLEADLALALAREETAKAEIARLSAALEGEELVARQIRARNEALHAKLDAFESEIKDQMAALTQSAEAAEAARSAAEARAEHLRGELLLRDTVTSQLRRVNVQLRQNNLALRDAVLRGLPEPNLVNKAMLAELEALRASREAERAEIDTVLNELRQILEAGGILPAEQGGSEATSDEAVGPKDGFAADGETPRGAVPSRQDSGKETDGFAAATEDGDAAEGGEAESEGYSGAPAGLPERSSDADEDLPPTPTDHAHDTGLGEPDNQERDSAAEKGAQNA